eukprot:4041903-Amphidinium_carterae.1
MMGSKVSDLYCLAVSGNVTLHMLRSLAASPPVARERISQFPVLAAHMFSSGMAAPQTEAGTGRAQRCESCFAS